MWKTYVVAIAFWVGDGELGEVNQYVVVAKTPDEATELAEGLSVEDEYYTTYKTTVESVVEVKK